MMRHFPFVLACAAATIWLGSAASAQQPRGPFGGGAFGTAASLGLLQNERVASELELTEDQRQRLRALGEKLREESRDLFSGLRDADPEERRARFAEVQEKLQSEVNKGLDDILLPRQRERLNQIRFQMGTRGATSGLTSRQAVEELELSDEQVEQLRQRAEELRGEIREKVQEIEAEAREKLLDVLTPAQREKYKKLVGQPFELQGFGGGFQGFGRGGEDGQRGGFRGRGGRGGEDGQRGGFRGRGGRGGEDGQRGGFRGRGGRGGEGGERRRPQRPET